jgi:predicted metal-dependent hydrolase
MIIYFFEVTDLQMSKMQRREIMSNYPQAYIEYLIYFHAERDFFECHEVMEEYWKEHPGDPLSSAYVGCIQTAVSMYHQRRGNRPGAVKMLRSALNMFTDADLVKLGIAAAEFRARLTERLELLAEPDFQYSDLNIPLSDSELTALCLELCAERQLIWQSTSNLTDTYLIHKHTLRDRGPVVTERERSIQLKHAAKRGQE